MVKLQSYKGKHFLTVPKEVILDASLKGGENFIVTTTLDKETIMFRKLKI